MPGATVAKDVSCAWEMAAKLDMMPQTVPNRPTNGATDEMTARLGKPPSERVSSSRAARAIASEMRPRRSLTVSPGMRRRASSSPATAIASSGFGIARPARAVRTAPPRRTTEIAPSMIKTQHQSEARNSTPITNLPTRLASRKSPTGDRFNASLPSHTRQQPTRAPSKKSLQQSQQRAARLAAQLSRSQRLVVIDICLPETLLDHGEVLVLRESPILVEIGRSQLALRHPPVQFLRIQRAVVIVVEFVEQRFGGLFRLCKIDRSIGVRVKSFRQARAGGRRRPAQSRQASERYEDGAS